MDSTLFSRANAIIPFTTGADLTGKEGYVCKLSTGLPVLNDSATVKAYGLILAVTGNYTSSSNKQQASILPFGAAAGVVKVKLGGNVTDITVDLEQKNDGTVLADAGSGGRVVVARPLETGATDEMIDCIILEPKVLS